MNIDEDQSRRTGCVIYGIFLSIIALVVVACVVCGAVVNSWPI